MIQNNNRDPFGSPEQEPVDFDHLATELERYAQTGQFQSGDEIGLEDNYSAPLSGETPEGHASGTVNWLPHGKNSDPTLRGEVRLEYVENPGVAELFTVRAIPDGFDFEKHTTMARVVPNQVKGINAILDALGAAKPAREASEQMSRELGMASVTPEDAKKLLGLISKDEAS